MSDSFVTSWTVALQAPLSIAFPRQEFWSGLPFPSLGDLSCPGIKPKSPALYIGRFFTESDTQTKQLNYLLSSLLLLYSYSFPFSTSISNNCISSSFPLFAYFQLLVFTAIEIWFSFIPLTLNGCPSSQWRHPTISSSVMPFSSHLQFFPASESFLVSQFFVSGGQSTRLSASALVLPMNIQDWFL